ncbi:MAG: zinc ribbon domain-containing protein [Chloroflexota bacterium]|nr:zinc ribbon domain-containing protein [Chloroflexota bacterium]
MPIYEFFCKHCDGIFETIRPISRASEAAPCPVCAKKGERIPPTSFSAFTMREGYPRAIPDRGTYYHLGKEVKKPITGAVRMNEHPELNKPRPKRKKTKGEMEIIEHQEEVVTKENTKMLDSGVMPTMPARSPYRDKDG